MPALVSDIQLCKNQSSPNNPISSLWDIPEEGRAQKYFQVLNIRPIASGRFSSCKSPIREISRWQREPKTPLNRSSSTQSFMMRRDWLLVGDDVVNISLFSICDSVEILLVSGGTSIRRHGCFFPSTAAQIFWKGGIRSALTQLRFSSSLGNCVLWVKAFMISSNIFTMHLC